MLVIIFLRWKREGYCLKQLVPDLDHKMSHESILCMLISQKLENGGKSFV